MVEREEGMVIKRRGAIEISLRSQKQMRILDLLVSDGLERVQGAAETGHGRPWVLGILDDIAYTYMPDRAYAQ